MGSLKIMVLQYARAMWRRKWYAIAVAWAVCVVGWVVVSRMPDQYESLARVYMNSDAALTPLLRGLTVDNDIDQRIDQMQRTLLSAPHMKKLIRMTDLDVQVKGTEEMERMIQTLQARVAIRSQTRNLFTVSYPRRRSAAGAERGFDLAVHFQGIERRQYPHRYRKRAEIPADPDRQLRDTAARGRA